MENTLYYGDNLEILGRYIADESIDLVYLDPPFNSNIEFNMLFAEKDGSEAASQIYAFTDSWTWNQESEVVFDRIATAGGRVASCVRAFREFLGECDMLAYLVMMAPRLAQLRRVLKPTGSIYLHCDPTASHYLKMLMDAVFGPENYKNEIIWQRSNAHNDAGQYGRIHDTLLFYVRSHTETYTWNPVTTEYSKEQLRRYKREDGTGRLYRGENLTASRLNSNSGKFNWRGTMPPPTRGWGHTLEQLEAWWDEGRILTKKDGTPRMDGLKQYLDEMEGKALQSIWCDIPRIGNTAAERLGYPTQKPEALLERIIRASCPEGGSVLDPFCGCGTTIAAAQKLGRAWIGIDITHLAIALIKKRLADSFGNALPFKVIGEPVSVPDAERLAESDPYQFQLWALGLVGARPAELKKGADKGIDGKIIFKGDKAGWYETVILSVKAGHTNPAHVRDLRGVVEREKAAIGVLISMQEPTGPMKTEALKAGLFESKTWGRKYPKLQLLTVNQLLEGDAVDMPPIRQVSATFKQAPRREKKGGEQKEFDV